MTITVRRGAAAAAGLCLALGGCAGVPKFDTMTPAGASGPVRPVIGHIVCELRDARRQEGLKDFDYVAKALLTLKVDDSHGFAPSLSAIHPLRVEGTSQTTTLGGEITKGRTRTYSATYAFDSNKLLEALDASQANGTFDCEPFRRSALAGDLGLAEIMRSGLDSTRGMDVAAHLRDGDGEDAPQVVFGSTVEFTLKQGLNGGPTWERVHFKGPGEGLLKSERTDTSTLTITFAETPKARAALDEETRKNDRRNADKAASSLLNTMILQNSILRPNR